MKITGITWITTYNCNLNCAHCFFETQGPKKYMDAEMVDMALASLKNTKHMFWQHLSGGEIFLDEDKLFDIIRTIRKYFKKDLGLSTNAFWAKDEVQTNQKVKELIELGVTGIALSADYYHQQFMSTNSPQILAKAVKENNINTHSYIMGARLSLDVLGAEDINSKSDRIAIEVNQNLGLPYARATERSIGKGCLINTPKKKGIPQGKCTELNTCLGERSPFNPAMVWIDPYGNVSICYGIIIGNLNDQSLNDIIENYTSENYPFLHELAKDGPKAIYKACLEKGINMPDAYYDECDLCYQSRAKLRELTPEVFGPAECYPV